MISRVWRGSFMAAGFVLAFTAPASAHGLHSDAAGAVHAVLHAMPVLAVVVAVALVYRAVRAKRAE